MHAASTLGPSSLAIDRTWTSRRDVRRPACPSCSTGEQTGDQGREVLNHGSYVQSVHRNARWRYFADDLWVSSTQRAKGFASTSPHDSRHSGDRRDSRSASASITGEPSIQPARSAAPTPAAQHVGASSRCSQRHSRHTANSCSRAAARRFYDPVRRRSSSPSPTRRVGPLIFCLAAAPIVAAARSDPQQPTVTFQRLTCAREQPAAIALSNPKSPSRHCSRACRGHARPSPLN